MEINNANVMEIKDLPGEILVYPLHYLRCDLALAIPEPLRTVKDLRDEMNAHPENEFLLKEVIKDINIITSKLESSEEAKKVEKVYEEAHNSTELLAISLYARIAKEAKEKKMRQL